jgi:phage terminase large subunit GpA-like protein
VKWEHGRPETAWYECSECGRKIYNHEKEEMLRRGEWRAEDKNYRGKTAGFHLSSLYSPVGWFSWGQMASMFTEAKQNIELLKVFVNTCLGETWVDRGDAPEWEKLFMRSEAYGRGTVPQKGLILVAGADVQKDRIEVQIIAYGRNRENWSVDYRVYPGDTADINSDPWKRLDALLSEGFTHESGTVFYIRTLSIDTGFNTQTVYNYCRRFPIGRVMPVKGQSTGSAMLGQPKAVDVVLDGKKKSRALKIWPVNVNIIKQELYAWLKYPRPEAGEDFPAGYCHFPEYEEEFFRQITAEFLSMKDVKGRKVFEWVQIRPRNEALDTAVYARAATALLQIDKFTGEDWNRLEEIVVSKGTNSKPSNGGDISVQKNTVPARGRRTISKGVLIE